MHYQIRIMNNLNAKLFQTDNFQEIIKTGSKSGFKIHEFKTLILL